MITAGLEPSAISFPLRKILQRECNVHFRVAEIQEISAASKEIRTNIGYLKYDYLALVMGTNPNFFGHASFGDNTLPIKSNRYETDSSEPFHYHRNCRIY